MQSWSENPKWLTLCLQSHEKYTATEFKEKTNSNTSKKNQCTPIIEWTILAISIMKSDRVHLPPLFLASRGVLVGGQPLQTVSRPVVFNQRLFDFMHCFTFTASVLLMARPGWKQPRAHAKIVPARGRVQCVPGVQDFTSKTQTRKQTHTQMTP